MRLTLRVIAAVLMLASFQAHAASTEVQCRHFWEREDGSRIASSNVVGEDVGVSPYGNTGVYECEVSIVDPAALRGGYLYIGEVGDASYLSMESHDGVPLKHPIVFTHGWDPLAPDRARYLRFLPFLASSDQIFADPGLYRFTIHYKDIVPFQTGIRSGPPAILSGSDLAKRILRTFGGSIYLYVQALAALFAALFFVSWSGLPIRRRVALALAPMTAAVELASLTGVPRLLFPPDLAVRFNDFSVIATVTTVNFVTLLFIQSQRPGELVKWAKWLLSATILIFGVQCALPFYHSAYLPTYAFNFALSSVLLPLLTVICLISGRAVLAHHPRPAILFFIVAWTLKSLAFAWDAIDLAFLDAKYPFVGNYFYLALSLAVLIRMQLVEISTEGWFRARLEEIRRDSMLSLSRGEVAAVRGLDLLATEIGKLMDAERVSFIELLGATQMRFVGSLGTFTSTEGVHTVDGNSVFTEVIRSGEARLGRGPRRPLGDGGSSPLTDYLVLPLKRDHRVVGLLSVTNLRGRRISPFYLKRIEAIRNECETLFSLLLSERRIQTQACLLQLNRLRVHPLQAESEGHFLENFDLSPSLVAPAFILGDLVDSTLLNERFGATAVKAVIDGHLREAFEKFRHEGAIFNRDKGDSISILIPNRAGDASPQEAAFRAYRIIRWLTQSSDSLQVRALREGIVLPFEFRLAMSMAKVTLQDSGRDALAGFQLLADPAIDAAARVIGSIAVAGEAIILEPAVEQLEGLVDVRAETTPLPPTRLKGKLGNIKLFRLEKPIGPLRNAA